MWPRAASNWFPTRIITDKPSSALACPPIEEKPYDTKVALII